MAQRDLLMGRSFSCHGADLESGHGVDLLKDGQSWQDSLGSVPARDNHSNCAFFLDPPSRQ